MDTRPIGAGATREIAAHTEAKPPAPQQEKPAGEVRDSLTLSGAKKKGKAKAAGTAPETKALDPKATIDEVATIMGKLGSVAGWTRSDLYSAEREVRDAGTNLTWSRSHIRRVEYDNDKTDVHMEGYTIDNYIRSAKRDIDDGGRQLDTADGRVDDMKEAISYSYKKLEALEKELQQKPDEYRKTLEHLAAAKKSMTSAFDASGRTARDIGDSDRKLDDTDRELMWTDSQISHIKFDSVGKDVSFEGRQLGYAVDRSEWNLRDAERSVSSARMDLGGVESGVSGALDALKKAKESLG